MVMRMVMVMVMINDDVMVMMMVMINDDVMLVLVVVLVLQVQLLQVLAGAAGAKGCMKSSPHTCAWQKEIESELPA